MLLAENIPASSATPLIPRLEDRPVADERFDAVGYGIQQPDDDLGETAGVRMRANGNAVACVGAIACQGTDATNTEWVAEVPICSGDSGGPALDAQGRVIGVASRSNIDCSAGLYEAVDSWKDMIIEAAHDAAEQGGYEPPTWAASAPSSGGTAGTGSGGIAGTGSGGTGTAGAGTAGTPSAGTGGSPTAGTGPGSSGGGNTAGRDPTGTSCTNSSCPNGYLCYAADEPPGICVPACSSLDTECPTGYACDVRVGACEPEEDDKPSRRRNQSDEGCGCRTAPASSRADQAWGILALAGIFAGTLRRRRRARR
jgi:MYXO-CTERM domain-containing protein